MVYVRLEKEWTDGNGVGHSAGDMIDVDAATLAKLQAAGIVAGESAEPGSTGGGQEGTDWLGPT
ncbi:hypothetical protein [Micromonospora sp. HM5-17]|jgi:hypothetical protein|uniref:hypothetical protein n=1 Tax=Micromonospora sp. HM5-17 TaxID=2487710 RepID=UPI000F45FF68|nr:hypothetical protein [Micromonospora sp. HM5-17]ROT31293.1 hypothetical protein EF879_17005 [Micromonospora sp. HM5-17]